MEITPANQPARLLSSEPWRLAASQCIRSLGADVVIESFSQFVYRQGRDATPQKPVDLSLTGSRAGHRIRYRATVKSGEPGLCGPRRWE